MANAQTIQSVPAGGQYDTDVIVIGAGPVGLFAVFELGMLGIKSHLIDILDRPGGQCAELYPEKPILDIPAIKSINGNDLTDALLDQISPFDATFSLNEMAVSLEQEADKRWRVKTDLDTEITGAAVCIAAGGGSFQPKKPPIPGVDDFEGQSVFYAVRKREIFNGKSLVIAGGGDSALDWTLNLEPIAKHVTLVHRRPDFRAAPDSVEKMHALVDAGKIDLKVMQIKELDGKDGNITGVRGESKEDGDVVIPCNMMLAFYGLTMKLGPIAEFGLNLYENRIAVDTAKFETSTPGVFCIGDMANYDGKLKLILSGFHEAALMAHAVFHYVFPDKKLRFQHSTSSKDLQKQVAGETK